MPSGIRSTKGLSDKADGMPDGIHVRVDRRSFGLEGISPVSPNHPAGEQRGEWVPGRQSRCLGDKLSFRALRISSGEMMGCVVVQGSEVFGPRRTGMWFVNERVRKPKGEAFDRRDARIRRARRASASPIAWERRERPEMLPCRPPLSVSWGAKSFRRRRLFSIPLALPRQCLLTPASR